MNTLSLTVEQVASTSRRRREVVQQVSRRTQICVDGTPLRDLLDTTGECLFDVWPVHDAVHAVTLGHVGDAQWPAPERVPLFVCSCGDPFCGALTCRVTTRSTSVTWEDIAWENFSEEQDRTSLDLPGWTFERSAYVDALTQGAQAARALVESAMRAKTPSRWGRRRGRKLVAGGGELSLDWLFVEAIEPDVTTARGSLLDFLECFEEAQATLAGTRMLDDEALAVLADQLELVRDSPHAVRLPPPSRDAVAALVDGARNLRRL